MDEGVKIETSKLDFDEKDFLPAPKPVAKKVAPPPAPVKKVEKKAPKKEDTSFEIETTTMVAPDIEVKKQ